MRPRLGLRSAQALALLAAFWAQAALAHVEHGEAGGLLTGLLHPLSGLDHVLAMVAVGLWGAQLGAPAIWVLPIWAFNFSNVNGDFLRRTAQSSPT